MVAAHIRLQFRLQLQCSRRAAGSRRLAGFAYQIPDAKHELLKLCARVGYTPH